jgi:hypothetical protein
VQAVAQSKEMELTELRTKLNALETKASANEHELAIAQNRIRDISALQGRVALFEAETKRVKDALDALQKRLTLTGTETKGNAALKV